MTSSRRFVRGAGRGAPLVRSHADQYPGLPILHVDAHPEPGGLTSRDVLQVVQRFSGRLGADIVELNPFRDPSGITARVAARLLKEVAARR